MVLATLATLSAAEQFFETLAVPYEQEVIDVSRLHILKRFRELIRTTDMKGLGDTEVEAVCRAALIEAYEEFAEGRGAKTFKVFRDAMPGFVPLAEIRRPT
ncbi:MAG: nitrogenase [Magnetospirillum sp.]|nr:MAG: nitrogenase [Magnetospirillum sp.]